MGSKESMKCCSLRHRHRCIHIYKEVKGKEDKFLSTLHFLCRFFQLKLSSWTGLLDLATEQFGLIFASVQMLEDADKKASSNKHSKSGWKDLKSFLLDFPHTSFV